MSTEQEDRRHILSHPSVAAARKAYLDKYEGGPPYRGEDAYRAYFEFLEDWIASLPSLEYKENVDCLEAHEYSLIPHEERCIEQLGGYETVWTVRNRKGEALTPSYGTAMDAMSAARKQRIR